MEWVSIGFGNAKHKMAIMATNMQIKAAITEIPSFFGHSSLQI